MIQLSQSVGRGLWTLERFGLTPGKLSLRVRRGVGPRVFCVSIPKAGTHLLERALCLHPLLYRKLIPTVTRANLGKWGGFEPLLERLHRGQVIMAHLPFEPRYPDILGSQGVPFVFLIRDPRDIAVSHLFNISGDEDHRLHQVFKRIPGISARLKLVIEGNAELKLPSIDERMQRFSGWLESGGLMVRFEDLIGIAGGGDPEAQRATLLSLYGHLGLDAGEELAASIGGQLFSSRSPTFRKGATGQWRSYFDPATKAIFNAAAGRHLIGYGYETSPSW